MVVGFNTDGSDDFAIVLLAPLGPGQTISATDDGWRTDTSPHAFNGHSSERHITHTAATDEAAGTVLTVSDFDGTLSLSSASDQLLVYQGTQASPTFVCALDNSGRYANPMCAGSVGGWHQASCSVSSVMQFYSALPAGLTAGVNALAWAHKDNWAYAGASTGSASVLRAAIAQQTHWTSSDSSAQPFISSHSVKLQFYPAAPLLLILRRHCY